MHLASLLFVVCFFFSVLFPRDVVNLSGFGFSFLK